MDGVNDKKFVWRVSPEFLIGLAATLVVGGLPLLLVPVLRLPGVLILVAGCVMFLRWSWDKSFRHYIAVRVGAVAFVLLICGYIPLEMYRDRGWWNPVSAVHEFNVAFYNGANDPEFFVDKKPSQPAKYSSGIATFYLATGRHTIQAEYGDRTCSAMVSVPLSEPAAATCNLK